jgi:hypothetical protein
VIDKLVDHILSPSFIDQYMKQPTSNTPLPERITSNPKFFPWFDGAMGGIDGTHIHATPSADDAAPHRSRKGDISQNMMACSTFHMLFTYICSGWEGSASDGMIFEEICHDGR